MVSRKCTCQLSSGHTLPMAAAAPAFGHDGVGLAQQGLADEGGAQPPFLGLDGGPQPGATGADDDDVEIRGSRSRPCGSRRAQKIFGSWKAPLATRRT